MRLFVVPLLGLALAMGCDQTSPVAPSETSPAFGRHQTEHTDSRDGEFEIRGFEGCFGELVVVTGTIRFKEHTVTSTETGNVDHSSVTFFLNGTGVGQTTGAVYKFKEISRLPFNTPNLEAPHATFKRQLITHLVSQGPQPNVKIKLALHVVITGLGVTKVVVDSDKGPCPPT